MRSRWQYTPTTDHVAVPPVIGEPVDAAAPRPAAPAAGGAGAEPLPPSQSPSQPKPEDPRWQQLLALVSQLPPDKAEKLREMLGGDGLVMANSEGLGQVLKALELRRGDEGAAAGEPLMRRICQLLEPFLVDEDADAGAGRIRRTSLVPWWEASLAQSPAIQDIDQQYRRAIREKLGAERERLEGEAMAELARRARTLTIRNIAQAVIEDVRRIGIILGGGMALAKVLTELGVDGAPEAPGIELDEPIVRRFGRAYEALGAERTFDPVWLGHAVMNHLARPWEVVTLIHRVTGCTDVHMLEQTELAPLVDRTMEQMITVAGRAQKAIKEASRHPTAAAIEAAARGAVLYFDLAEAIAREIKLERSSHWGQAYMASRKNLSDLIADTLEDFEAVIGDFLDDWTADAHGQDDHPGFLAAVAAADFLGAMKLRATRHGFGMPFTALERRLQDSLGRVMKRPKGNAPDPWPGQKRRLLGGLRLI